ncbi:MAG: ComF family protein [Candidatus Aminicenantes bacterium]|nr:ComF family protein [Candidatus Aminicenantes bacterium]
MLARLLRLADVAFFPSFCRSCGLLLERPGERLLCRDCLGRIVPHRAPRCPVCGRFFEGEGGGHPCGACLGHPPPFSLHRSAGRYGAVLKDAILLLKYRGGRPLARDLAAFAWEALRREDGLWEKAEVLVPVPLHRRRLRERGFNQSALLARAIGRAAGIPVETRALKKVRPTPAQTSLEHGQRRTNVRGAFAVARPERVRGRVVVVIDDVFTTGATLRECAAELRKAGAGEVRAATVAQA